MPELHVTVHDESCRISFAPGLTVREILDLTDIRLRSSCGGVGGCGLCSIHVISGEANDFTSAELNKLTPDQRKRGIRLACQVTPVNDLHIILAHPAPHSNWQSLSSDDHCPAFDRLQPVKALSPTETSLGVAIDLGTTQIRVSVWNRNSAVRLAGRSGLNPQACFGADVLTRMVKASESRDSALQMSSLAINSIGEALADISVREGINLHDIGKLVIVGNTPMLSLLTGKNYDRLIVPDYWTKEIDCVPADVHSLAKAWGCAEQTAIDIIRPMAGFVGSDLLAGIIATQLTTGPAGSLLIDFGTNSEIALWDGEKVWITSAAGGPAFEGCGISYGLPAEPGAIYRVKQQKDEGYAVEVIGGRSAKGICGSGLVDMIACMIKSGHLRKNGRFNLEIQEEGYPIVKGGDGVFLKKGDVDLFQRAKAGIAAAIQCLMKRSTMNNEDVQRIYVCGAFGSYLNIKNGQKIGLLPTIPENLVKLCGNTALSGCELLLFSPDPFSALHALKQKAQLLNMANNVEFEMKFIENLFLQPMQDV